MSGSYEAIVSPAVSSSDTLSVAQDNQVRDKLNHVHRNLNQRRSIDETTDLPTHPSIPVKLTPIVEGSVGFYKCKRSSPPFFPETTGDISETDLGTPGKDDEAYAYHPIELTIAATVHLLDTDGI